MTYLGLLDDNDNCYYDWRRPFFIAAWLIKEEL